jgi:hypothetical protein
MMASLFNELLKFVLMNLRSLLAILSLISLNLYGQVTFTDSDLPIVVVNTGGNEITDTTRIIADMGIIYNGVGNRNYMTDPFNHFFGKISIEIRGSTSQQYPKKCYGLETQDILGNNLDTALLGMPSENDWILYGAYPDKTLIRNEITFDLFRKMGHYDSRYEYVELVIDGDYRGVYSLMEKIKRDKNRVDVAKLTAADISGDELTGGYIIKVDKLTGSSNTYWTSILNPGVKYLYHDPQDNELLPVQQDYIKDYVTNFETVMNSANFNSTLSGYPTLIDVNSFVDFMLMQELGRTVDGYRSSSFMYKNKDSKGGLLHAGPMWDFNLSYGNADYCDAYDTTGYQFDFNTVCPTFTSYIPFFWEKFLVDTGFTKKLQCRWQQLRASVLHKDSIELRIDAMALKLNESKTRNFQRWPILGTYVNWNYFVGNTYQEEIDYLKWWFNARSNWMDDHLPGVCDGQFVGTDVIMDAAAYQVFPNPATDYMIIKVYEPLLLTNAKLTLLDASGVVVLQQSDINTNEIMILRNHLPSGMYFYCLQSNHSIFKGKILFK